MGLPVRPMLCWAQCGYTAGSHWRVHGEPSQVYPGRVPYVPSEIALSWMGPKWAKQWDLIGGCVL